MATTDDWSTTANSNGTTLGINVAEGCDAANINNAIREMMAELKAKLDAQDSAITAAGTADPTIAAIAALTFAADQFMYSTGPDAFSVGPMTAFGRTLAGLASYSALLTGLGFAYSTTGTPGSAGWKLSVDIPIPALGTLRFNFGITSVSGNTAVTDTFQSNFTTLFGAVGPGVNSANTSDGDNVYAYGNSTSTIGLTNGVPSTLNFFWLAVGLK